jgi:mannan endo-1,4-beta-mannosidase
MLPVLLVSLFAGTATGASNYETSLSPAAFNTGPGAGSDSSGLFVTRSGTQLLLGGKAFQFTGINAYNANSQDNCFYSMASGQTLDASMTAMGPGVQVMRSWFFQHLATTANGSRDWTAFDHTLAVARAHNVRVIATFGNQWSDCDGSLSAQTGYKNESWYRDGYRSSVQPGDRATYRDWVMEVVRRYGSDPTIMSWQLMNEAEDSVTMGAPCSSTAGTTMQGFVRDMAGLVKSADSQHLLSVGTVGSGQCGASGTDYSSLHAIPGVDLCEYHDYSLDPMPGDQWNGLATRVSQCSALNKPLFIGETGVRPSDVGGTLTARANLLQTKISQQFRNGVAGELVWAWRDAAHGGSSSNDYYVGPNDPTLAMLSAFNTGPGAGNNWPGYVQFRSSRMGLSQ